MGGPGVIVGTVVGGLYVVVVGVVVVGWDVVVVVIGCDVVVVVGRDVVVEGVLVGGRGGGFAALNKLVKIPSANQNPGPLNNFLPFRELRAVVLIKSEFRTCV